MSFEIKPLIFFIAGFYRPPSSLTRGDASIAKNVEKVYCLTRK